MGAITQPWWVEEADKSGVIGMMSEVRRADRFVLRSHAGMVETGQHYYLALDYKIKSNYCSRCYMFSNSREWMRLHSSVKTCMLQVCLC